MATGSFVDYAFCPPSSGDHYIESGVAPLTRPSNGFFDPNQTLRPGNWVHNLEHGYVVILYKGTPDSATLDSIKSVANANTRAIALRFDTMDTPYAVVAWDRSLLLPVWDATSVATFADQWRDGAGAPEPGA